MSSSDKELFVSFNQDAGCFAVGSDQGFHIFNVDPFQKMFHRDFSMGGIAIVEMLYRSNILALVGGGLNPRHPANKVLIWDDHQSRSIGEISVNRDQVLGVKLKRDLVVVVVERHVNLYNFRDLKLIDRIETWDNKLGLVALSPSSTRHILAMPGTKCGQVRIENHLSSANKSSSVFIQAHESELQCLALNVEGTMVATASVRGTLIRVFQTDAGQPLYELRRGADPAIIQCIAFNNTNTFLACSSGKGTCHVFSLTSETSSPLLPPPTVPPVADNSATGLLGAQLTGLFSSFKDKVLPKYFSSEWSYAQFRIPPLSSSSSATGASSSVADGGVAAAVSSSAIAMAKSSAALAGAATAVSGAALNHRRIMVAFGAEKNTIVVVSSDGRFFRASFDGGPGECVEKSRERFFYDPEVDAAAAANHHH